MSSQLPNWAAAAELINTYLDDSLVIPTTGGQKLKGLMIDADHIREIIDNPSHNIQKVFMIFGMKKSGTNKEVNLVLVGIDDNDKLVTDPAYDYCDPCPNDCGDLSSHL